MSDTATGTASAPETDIHPTAIIDPQAEIAEGVRIGPYCVIEGPVQLAEGVRLESHVHLRGPLSIGPRTRVWSFACLGLPPQDFKFDADHDATAGVVIGSDCIIREHMTIHAATNDHTPTTVGNGCFLMGVTHIAHDCTVGNNVIMVNGAGMAGHCKVGDGVIFSGSAIIHQFVRVGRLAMFSGAAAASVDVPPFCVVNERQRMGHINLVGMRRAGMSREDINAVKQAFRRALRPSLPRAEVLAILDELGADSPAVREMAEFVRGSKRICPGMSRGARAGGQGEDDVDEAGD